MKVKDVLPLIRYSCIRIFDKSNNTLWYCGWYERLYKEAPESILELAVDNIQNIAGIIGIVVKEK